MVPESFSLAQNYPNPFNPLTAIAFTVPRTAVVKIEVLDILGRHVVTLLDREMPAGNHTVEWDAADSRGEAVASGLYLCRLQVDSLSAVRKMILLR